MYYKVRIKRLPKAQSGLEIKMRAGLGFNANQLSWPVMAGEFSEPDMRENRTLGPIPRDFANLEAEVGETAVTNLNADGIPEQYMIGGKRHYAGGTPLNLPDNSYIFSRDKSMKIKDLDILEQFGITKVPKGGVTPADIAKRYDINKYKKTLLDKNSDDLARNTAERMIQNYVVKLGKLAVIQESMKGFPEGIPMIASAYLESVGIDPEEILPNQQQTEQMEANPVEEEDDQAQENPYADLPIMAAKFGRQTGYNHTPKYLRQYTNGGGTGYVVDQYHSVRSERRGRVLPPLSPDMAKATPEFDPRLSAKSNEKYNKFYKAMTSDPKISQALQEELDLFLVEAVNSGEMTLAQANLMRGKTGDDLMKDFMLYQKQNWALFDADEEAKKTLGISIYDKRLNLFDTPRGANANNQQVGKILEARGWKPTDYKIDGASTRQSQAVARALAKVSTRDEFKDVFKGFSNSRGGIYGADVDPENKLNPITGKATMSPVDDIYGDDTSNVLWAYQDEQEDKEPCDPCPDGTVPERLPDGSCPCGEKKTCPPCPDGTIVQPDKDGNCPCKTPIEPPKDSPWWLQDIVRTTGALSEYTKIKKYMPWQATPAVDYIEPTFYSPERELAANAEQLAIGAQGAAQFAGPQGYNARFAQMSGKAAANAADILGRYNNLNVGVANETEKLNVDIFNNYAAKKADSATMLYDKSVVANQQFDASKAKAREKIGNAYIQGITNAADAYNLNQLYPDYAINPLTGGKLMRKPPSRQVTPTTPTDYGKEYSQFVKTLPANTTDQERARLWELYKYGKNNQGGEDDERDKWIENWRRSRQNDYDSGYPGYGYMQ